MNKKYQAPALTILSLGVCQIVCTSPTPEIQSGSADTDNEQDGGGFQLVKGQTNYVDWDNIWE